MTAILNAAARYVAALFDGAVAVLCAVTDRMLPGRRPYTIERRFMPAARRLVAVAARDLGAAVESPAAQPPLSLFRRLALCPVHEPGTATAALIGTRAGCYLVLNFANPALAGHGDDRRQDEARAVSIVAHELAHYLDWEHGGAISDYDAERVAIAVEVAVLALRGFEIDPRGDRRLGPHAAALRWVRRGGTESALAWVRRRWDRPAADAATLTSSSERRRLVNGIEIVLVTLILATTARLLWTLARGG